MRAERDSGRTERDWARRWRRTWCRGGLGRGANGLFISAVCSRKREYLAKVQQGCEVNHWAHEGTPWHTYAAHGSPAHVIAHPKLIYFPDFVAEDAGMWPELRDVLAAALRTSGHTRAQLIFTGIHGSPYP